MLGAIALMLAILVGLTPARHWHQYEVLLDDLQQAGYWGIGLFMLAHAVVTAIGVPGTPLALAGGAVYGLVWGTIWSTLGATLGAIAAFWLARTYLRQWMMRRMGNHPLVRRMNGVTDHNPWATILVLRLNPLVPFNLINTVMGVCRMPLWPYSVGTVVGIIPGTAAFTWLGVSGMQAIAQQQIMPLVISFGGLLLLLSLPTLHQRWSARSSKRGKKTG
jgi:uncharacterized membrane protein YdjX (TVP38/TMEM64 family)